VERPLFEEMGRTQQTMKRPVEGDRIRDYSSICERKEGEKRSRSKEAEDPQQRRGHLSLLPGWDRFHKKGMKKNRRVPDKMVEKESGKGGLYR